MASETRRLLGRSLRDVTNVRPEDLRAEQQTPHLVQIENPPDRGEPAKAQVVCIASGKGGTGKTVVATNLAVALAASGTSVTLFDADVGLANAHLLLGIFPPHDIKTVLTGEKRLSEIAVEGPAGVRLVSGGSGFSDLAEMTDRQLRHLASEFAWCEETTSLILIDLPAGIGPQVMRFLDAAHDIILVTTPDITAQLDAYATIKSLAKVRDRTAVNLVVNRTRDREEAMEVFKQLQRVVARRLGGIDLNFFGWVPQKWYVGESVKRRRPLVLLHPKSFVTECITTMAARVKARHIEWLKIQNNAAFAEEGVQSPVDAAFSKKLGGMVYEHP